MIDTAPRVLMSGRHYQFSLPPAIVIGTCGHGLAVIRALNDGQVPVLALEANLHQPGARTRLAVVEQVADVNGLGLIEALLRLRPRVDCPRQPVLFLTNDTMVRTIAKHWQLLECHYALSWAHCRDKIEQLLDKHQLEAYCETQGCSYPPTWLLRSHGDIDAAMVVTGELAIVKPSQPLSGFKTALPRSRADFEALIERHQRDLPFLAQKFVPGDDTSIYFCALMLLGGEVLARFDGRKLRSRPMGHTTIAEASLRDDVYRETLRFFAGLNLSGPVSLELKRALDGRLWVIEPTVGRTDFWLGLCNYQISLFE